MIRVIAAMRAREGKENRLKEIMLALVIESRLEPGNIQYDLLVGDEDPLAFAVYEVWESAAAMNAHLRSKHISAAFSFSDELTEAPPHIISYAVVEPTRTRHTGPTRPLEPTDPSP